MQSNSKATCDIENINLLSNLTLTPKMELLIKNTCNEVHSLQKTHWSIKNENACFIDFSYSVRLYFVRYSFLAVHLTPSVF